MPELALTKASKHDDKENNKGINYINQLRENHGKKILTEMLLLMQNILNVFSVNLVVTEPQK